MKISSRLLAVALLAVSTFTFAQDYPDKSRPIRLVVPFGAGSGIDLVARAYVRAMGEAGISALVDNKPGADGVIGVESVKNAAADGYTVLFGNLSTHVLNAHMLPALRYDPVADFIPVADVMNVTLVLNAGPSTKFSSIKDVIDAARANPGKFTYASSTASTRLTLEMFEHLANVKLLSVPYKTQAQATAGLAAGEVDLLATDVVTALPYYQSGRLRPLGTSGRTRISALPNVPTIREQGVKDFEFSAWLSTFVPTRTPAEIVGKLRSILRESAKSKYVTDALAMQASEPLDTEPAQISARIRTDLDQWGKLLRELKAKSR